MADRLWKRVAGYIPEAERSRVAIDLIAEFRAEDCDTLGVTGLWAAACQDDRFLLTEVLTWSLPQVHSRDDLADLLTADHDIVADAARVDRLWAMLQDLRHNQG